MTENLILQVFGWHWRLFGLSGIPFFGCQQLVSWPTIVAAPRLGSGCRIEDMAGDRKRWRVVCTVVRMVVKIVLLSIGCDVCIMTVQVRQGMQRAGVFFFF